MIQMIEFFHIGNIGMKAWAMGVIIRFAVCFQTTYFFGRIGGRGECRRQLW